MAIDKGNIKTSANYDVKAQKPLDGRAVRPAKADLIKKESWSSDGNTVYVYEGMQVYVQDEKKTYYLKDLSKMFATDFSGWELMGTGAGGGITEEKEVYIGEEAPTDDGAKLWIDPTGTPSGGNGGTSGGGTSGGSNVYVFPEEVMSDAYTADNPYIFSDEKFNELKVALQNPSSVYVAYQFLNGNITSLHGSLSFTQAGWIASFFTCVVLSGTTYLGAYVFRLAVVSGKLTAFSTFSMLTLS